MKSILPHFLSLYTAALAVLAKIYSAQQVLISEDIMAQQDKIPGHNNAVYDIVPKEDQIFSVEFLEIAPTPIIADHIFFVYLRGHLPESKKKELELPDEGLVNATFTVSLSAIYADGNHDEEISYTEPLKTTPFGPLGHLTIHDTRGVQVDYIPSSGSSEILLDFQILAMFLRSGMWTFKVDLRLGDVDNTCLFAGSLTQWLEGRLH